MNPTPCVNPHESLPSAAWCNGREADCGFAPKLEDGFAPKLVARFADSEESEYEEATGMLVNKLDFRWRCYLPSSLSDDTLRYREVQSRRNHAAITKQSRSSRFAITSQSRRNHVAITSQSP